MNVLPKGIVTVIMATMVASFLILFYGNVDADSRDEKSEGMVLNVKSETVEAKEQVSLEAIIPEITVISPPPPGPFISENLTKNTGDQPLSLTSNKVVTSNLKKLEQVKPVALHEIEFKRMQPSMPTLSAPPVQPKFGSMERRVPEKLPVLKKSKLIQAQAEPIAPVLPEKVIGAIKVEKPVLSAEAPVSDKVNRNKLVAPKPSKIKPSEPIWSMKPPISPIINNSRRAPQLSQYSITQPLVPKMPRNMMRSSRGNQQYIYVPMPVYPPTFRYPQIPFNNNYGYSFSEDGFVPQTRPNRQGMPMKNPDLQYPDTIEKSK